MLFDEYISQSEEMTESYAKAFAKKLSPGDTVAFYGDLGAGKTAFTRGAVSILCPFAVVSSPTYAIMNEYKGDGISVCHFDLYRIHGEDDLYSIGFDDYTDGRNIIFTEWSENVRGLLPHPRYDITITKGENDTRNIHIEYTE